MGGLGLNSLFGQSHTGGHKESIEDLIPKDDTADNAADDAAPEEEKEEEKHTYEQPEPEDPNAPKLTKDEWFALRKKRYLTHEEYALYKLGFIKEIVDIPGYGKIPVSLNGVTDSHYTGGSGSLPKDD